MSNIPKRPRDANQLAKSIVDIAVGIAFEAAPNRVSDFAREGGLKGGKARAEKLTAEQRTAIATIAANARWKKKSD